MIAKILAHTQSTACPPQVGMPAAVLAGIPTTPSGDAPALFVSSDNCAHGRVQKPTEQSEALRLLEKFTLVLCIRFIFRQFLVLSV